MIEAGRLAARLSGSACDDAKLRLLRERLADNLQPESVQRNALVRQVLRTVAMQYIATTPYQNAGTVQAVVDGLLGAWSRHPLGRSFPLQPTIGAVRLRGEDAFGIGSDVVRSAIEAGLRPGSMAGIHLWLTLEDLTVLDLTLVPALRGRGLLGQDCARVLFWHPDDAGTFEYLPMLLADVHGADPA